MTKSGRLKNGWRWGLARSSQTPVFRRARRMMRNRWLLARILSTLVLLSAIGLVIAIVMANVLGVSSVAVALQQWAFWLLWGSIAAGIICAVILRRRPKREQASPVALSEVNEMYLGRRPTLPPSKSAASYSVYPPDEEAQ